MVAAVATQRYDSTDRNHLSLSLLEVRELPVVETFESCQTEDTIFVPGLLIDSAVVPVVATLACTAADSAMLVHDDFHYHNYDHGC